MSVIYRDKKPQKKEKSAFCGRTRQALPMLPLRPRDRAGPQRLAPEDPRPGQSTQWISFPESLTTPAPQSSHSQNVSAQRPVRGCDSEPSPSYRSRVPERFKDLPYCAPHLQPPSNGCALQNRRSMYLRFLFHSA